MRQNDAEFVQILNIIRRGQRLVLQAKKEGADISMAEELINEAKYALKLNKRERAIDYSKKAIFEVVRIKREMTKQSLNSKDGLKELTKVELRNLCTQYELDPVGVKDELVGRIWSHLESIESEPEEKEPMDAEPIVEEVEPAAVEEPIEVTTLEEPEPIEPEVKKGWAPSLALKELVPGLSYLVEERRPEKFFKIIQAAREQEIKGLIISRTNPKILKRKYQINEEDTIWLTGKEMRGDIRSVLPILEFIMSLFEEFMDKNGEGIILLDGLEYLLTNNKFNSVIRFLRQLVDNVSQTECMLLVSLSPDAMDTTQVTLLEKDLLPLDYISE